MRYFAAFCVPVDFTYFRSDSQKMRKSGQIADVCSSQIVVKIRGFTTKDFVGENQLFNYSIFFRVCIALLRIYLCSEFFCLFQFANKYLSNS